MILVLLTAWALFSTGIALSLYSEHCRLIRKVDRALQLTDEAIEEVEIMRMCMHESARPVDRSRWRDREFVGVVTD